MYLLPSLLTYQHSHANMKPAICRQQEFLLPLAIQRSREGLDSCSHDSPDTLEWCQDGVEHLLIVITWNDLGHNAPICDYFWLLVWVLSPAVISQRMLGWLQGGVPPLPVLFTLFGVATSFISTGLAWQLVR